MEWPEFWTWVIPDNVPPLYPVLVKLWAGWTGLDPLALRLPGALVAAACLPLFFFWTRKRFGPLIAGFALGLLAISPFYLFLGRIAKYFSLFGCLVCVALALTWRLAAEEEETPLRRLKGAVCAWGITLLAALWIQYLALAVWFSLGAWLLWRWKRGSRRARNLLGIQCVFFAGFLPWLPVAFARVITFSQSARGEAPDAPALRLAGQIAYTAYAFAVGHTLEPSHWLLAGLSVASFLLLTLAGIWLAARRTGSPLARFLLIQAALTGLVSFLILRIFAPLHPILSYAERLGFLLPVILVFPALALARMGRIPRTAFLAAYLPGVLFSLFCLGANRANLQWEYRIPWEQIRARTLSEGEPCVLVIDDWSLGSRGWYYFRDAGPVRVLEIRALQREGRLESEAARLASQNTPVFFLRSARDSSPGKFVARFGEILAATMREEIAGRYVEDSPAMERFKQKMRRGQGGVTYPHKILLLRYTPKIPPTANAEQFPDAAERRR